MTQVFAPFGMTMSFAKEKIGPELLEAIRESSISILIISKNYASSKWCLRQLAQMVDCKRSTEQLILPIFYDVEPSNVRRQSGSYEEAFRKHESCFDVHCRMPLVKIENDDVLRMHGQLRDLGSEIIRQEDLKNPKLHSRLWVYTQIFSLWDPLFRWNPLSPAGPIVPLERN
ncbi:disease resistance protein RPP5-like [Cornus florida]|uniref:disease resistance protein RPP5-like n=1 Tax=Cornus florida TaxID=4283 RepID=UPI0028A0B04D|nr:disease resistance protein RPP5-like [Cornus florida]